MNSANEKLRIIRNRKSLLTKERDESIAHIEECYKRDVAVLDNEEKELLSQFNDIPVNDIYKEPPVKKYRKKPLIVEAYVATEEEYIETLEGTMKANVGDYVITGIKGEKYPCKPDVFHGTYEEME